MTDDIPTLCTECGAAPWRHHSVALIGSLAIRQTFLCAACLERTAREAIPEELEQHLRLLGPIDFTILSESIAAAESEPRIPASELAAAAELLPDVARLHNQRVPPNVQAFIDRHRSR